MIILIRILNADAPRRRAADWSTQERGQPERWPGDGEAGRRAWPCLLRRSVTKMVAAGAAAAAVVVLAVVVIRFNVGEFTVKDSDMGTVPMA